MLNCKYMLVCENAIVDSVSKATSLINIVNGIKITKAPVAIPFKFVVHTAWERDAKNDIDDKVQIAVRQPDSDAEKILAEIKIPGSSLGHNHNLNIIGLKIDNFGDLYFIARVKEGENFREAGRCRFRIDKAA